MLKLKLIHVSKNGPSYYCSASVMCMHHQGIRRHGMKTLTELLALFADTTNDWLISLTKTSNADR